MKMKNILTKLALVSLFVPAAFLTQNVLAHEETERKVVGIEPPSNIQKLNKQIAATNDKSSFNQLDGQIRSQLIKSTGIALDATNFPDKVFRDYLTKNFDKDGDKYLSQTEVKNITYFEIKGVSSLTGVKLLTSLTYFEVKDSPSLKKIDVRGMKSLVGIVWGGAWQNNPNITEVDLRDCPNLIDSYHAIYNETVRISPGMMKYEGCPDVSGHTGHVILDLRGFTTNNPDGSKTVDLSKILSPIMLQEFGDAGITQPGFNTKTKILTIPKNQTSSNYTAGFDDLDKYTKWTFLSDDTSIGTVTAKYIDTAGKKISDDVVKTGSVGDAYKTEQKDIEGYTFKEVQGNASGKYTVQAQTVTYVYTKDPVAGGDVTAKYVDTKGNKISDDVVKSGNIGETYQTEQKDIEGYTFKEVKGNASGTFTDQAQTVTYVYTKDPVAGGDVTAKYVDTKGNKISDDVVKSGNIGETYQTEQKDIDGYTFKEVKGNASGTFTDQAQIVTYVYTKNPADLKLRRSLTIWKYQVKDLSDLGDRGDGTAVGVDKDVIPGIKFEIVRVKQKEGGASLTDPKKQQEGTDYEIDSSFTPVTITTDAEGKAFLDLGEGPENDGIYLVRELPDDRTDLSATDGKRVDQPADPFFVYIPQTSREDNSSWIYDVQVQPKNILEDLVNPDKTINNSKGDSVKAGQDFEWELESNIPAGLWQVASQDGTIDILDADGNVVDTVEMKKGDPIVYRDANGVIQPNFTMTDKLDDQLSYKDGSAKMQVKGADGTWVDLATGDYTVEFDATTNTIKTKLTEAGLQKVGTASNGYTDIRTVLTTKVADDWNGVLDNTFTVDHQIPGQKPKTTTPPPTNPNPKYANGGFDIEKTAEDTKNVLAGAEFKIADSEENAKNKIFLATDGKSYAEDATLPAGVTFLTATSDANGHAAFDGLELDWIDANKDGEAQDNEFSRDYWVVETKSPEGYELLKTPEKVTVTVNTHDDSNIELDVVDKPKTDLPFTGGEGTALLVTIALGAIAVGTAVVVIEKKRKQA